MPLNIFVLDTSALFAFRSNESGADRVEFLLQRARRDRHQLLASFMTRMELLYCIWRYEGEAASYDALRLVDSFNLEWVSCDPDILSTACRVKVQGGLSVADSWIAATTVVRGATLIHKDPEFTKFTELRQEFLR